MFACWGRLAHNLFQTNRHRSPFEAATATRRSVAPSKSIMPLIWYEQTCNSYLPDITVGTKLGAGCFGVVLSARHKPSDTGVALKVSNKRSELLSNPKALHRARAEARVLRKLGSCPFIVRCFGALEDDATLVLVLSLEAGSSLAHIVSTRGPMDEKAHGAPIAFQLARALRFCHQRKIAHRDVKLDNVVYDGARAVLVDFGLAINVRTQGSRLDVKCGSAEYNAPEVLDPASKGYYGPATDMWALGVLTYTLLVGRFPFGSAQTKICRGQLDKSALDASGCSAGAREFVAACLTVDPNSVQKVNRLSSAEACKHPWLRPYEPAVEKAAASVPPLPSDELSEYVGAAAARAAAERDGAVEAVDDGAATERATGGLWPGAVESINDAAIVADVDVAQGDSASCDEGREAEATARLLQLSMASMVDDDDEI